MENRHGKRKIIPYFGEDIEGRSEIMIVRIVCIFSLLSSPVFADEREKFDENDFLQAVIDCLVECLVIGVVVVEVEKSLARFVLVLFKQW